MGIQINGNTNNINAGIGSLSIEDINELDIVGVVTAANFKTGTSNVHSAGIEIAGINILGADTTIGVGATIFNSGGAIFAGTSGVVTATTFVGNLTGNPTGSGANLTNLPAANITGTLPAISGANLTGVLKNVVEDTSPQLGADLDTNSFEILFDDAHAAKFGNSSQFQIKHDGGGGDARLINTVGNLYSINSTNGWIILQPVSGQTGINVKPNAAVELMYSGNKKIETTSTGATVTGNLAFTSAGHGIDFGSSVHASGMSNELLDDYEEGSWTPVFATAAPGGSTVSNPSNTQATYVKVGRIVYLHLGVHGLTKNWAGSSTQVFIRGIPYRSYFQHSGHPVRHGYWGASDDDLNVYAQIHQYQTYISLQKGGGAQGRYEALYWSDMHWEGYGNLTMEITYETDQGV